MNPTSAEVQDAIVGMLQEIVGDSQELPEHVGPETLLWADVQLSSIDIFELLALAEARYQRRFPYHQLMIHDGQYVQDLRIGELADFIHTNFDVQDPGPLALN